MICEQCHKEKYSVTCWGKKLCVWCWQQLYYNKYGYKKKSFQPEPKEME